MTLTAGFVSRVATLRASILADPGGFNSRKATLLAAIVDEEEEAPAPPPVDPGYTPSSYHFDGTNVLNRGAGLTGAVDSKVGTIAGFINPDSFTSAVGQHIIRATGAAVSPLWINPAGDLSVWLKNAAGTEIMKLRLPLANFAPGQDNHFLFSWDLSDPAKRHGYVNDVECLEVDLYTNDTIDWTVSEWLLGNGPGGVRYLGSTADLGLWLEYVAASIEATRRKLVGEGGAAVDLGTDGSLATGTQPIIYLQSTATNLGSGGGFSLPVEEEPAPPPVEEGNVITATAGTHSAIQAAVDAAMDGDTVLIPDSTAQTNDEWLFGNGQVTTAKAIHIKGNGKNLCKIKRSPGSPSQMFVIDPHATLRFKFSGIDMEGLGFGNGNQDSAVVIRGAVQKFQIFDCRFEHFGHGAVRMNGFAGPNPGHSTGVIYNNEFNENGREDPNGTTHSLYAIVHYGDPDDDTAPAFGSDEAVYVEDNDFHNNHDNNAANNNARYVFRHNTATKHLESGGNMVDAHGKTSAWPLGTGRVEIYENDLDVGGVPCFIGVAIRGCRHGGVVFNNRVTGGPTHAVGGYLDSYEAKEAAGTQEDIAGLYVWGNTKDGVAQDYSLKLGQFQPDDDILCAEGTHYFNFEKPGYTPFTYPHPDRDDQA